MLGNKGISGPSPLTVIPGSTELLRYTKAQIIDSIYNSCTPTNIIALWVFDVLSGTTVQDRGTLNHDITLSANANTLSPGITGLCPNLKFNSTDPDYFSVADHADFSFGNAAADEAFSIVCLLRANASGNHVILAKDKTDGAGDREWNFLLESGELKVTLIDNSTAANIGRATSILALTDTASFHAVGFTYSASETSAGVKIYSDGVQVDDADRASGVYTAMENKAGSVANCQFDGATPAGVSNITYGVVAVINEELSAANMLKLSQVLLGYAGVNF